MLNEFQKDVAAYSLKKYGEESQILKTIEELGELSSALSRFLINKKVKLEMKKLLQKSNCRRSGRCLYNARSDVRSF